MLTTHGQGWHDDATEHVTRRGEKGGGWWRSVSPRSASKGPPVAMSGHSLIPIRAAFSRMAAVYRTGSPRRNPILPVHPPICAALWPQCDPSRRSRNNRIRRHTDYRGSIKRNEKGEEAVRLLPNIIPRNYRPDPGMTIRWELLVTIDCPQTP